MSTVLRASANIFFSLLLGTIAFAFSALYAPEWTNSVLDQAAVLKDSIIWALRNMGVESSVNVLIRFVLKDEQFALMAYVITTRIILALLMWAVGSLYRRAVQ